MSTADERANRGRGRPSDRRARNLVNVHRRLPAPSAASALAFALALLAAGCGAEASPGIGNDTVPTTVATTTTASTLPPETTTTIDFAREPAQEKTPLPEDATADEVAEVVGDMRGPTRDLSEQLSRLATFMKLSSPAGAQILDFATSVVPAEDDRNEISTQVSLRAPQTMLELNDFFDAELRARGWYKADEAEETIDDVAQATLVFRIPGTAGDETELSIVILGGPVTMIDLDFRFLTPEDDPSFELLSAWQAAIRTPRSTTALAAGVVTAEDSATLSVTYAIEADTAAEGREDITDLVRSSEFEIETAGESGESAAPVVLIDEAGQRYLLEFGTTRDPEVIEMVVSTTFDLRPID